jgi:predicted porin
LTPYASYTATQFKLSQPTSKAWEGGLTWDIDDVYLRGSYTRYDAGAEPQGGGIINYYSLALGADF